MIVTDPEAGTSSSSDNLPAKEAILEEGPGGHGAALQPTPHGPRPYGRLRWILILFSLYAAAFLYGLDNTIVADVQPAVIAAFGGDVSKLAWLGIGFPLGSIASVLPIMKAFSSFDAKSVFLASLVMFTAGSALCGGAPDMDALIVGRVWAGSGGAGMYLGVLTVLTMNTTLNERPLYLAGCGLVWGVGAILGPVIGGGFADSDATWRWAFYLNIVIFAVCAPVLLFALKPSNPDPETPFLKKLGRLDWVGTVLYTAMYVCFVVGFTFAGSTWEWQDGRVITFIAMFGVLFLAFAIQQTWSIFTTHEYRLFPVDFLKDRTLVLLYLSMSAVVTGLFVPVYYIPLHFSFARGDSNIDSAIRLLPFIAVVIFFIVLNGILMPKFGYYAPWYTLSGVFLLIGGALMYTLVDPTTSNARVYGFTVLTAVGAGATQQAAYSVAQALVSPDRIPDAVGYINSAQIGGVVIALTITGAVFQNVGFNHLSDALEGQGFSGDEIHSALAGVRSSIFSSIDVDVRVRVIEGIVSAISETYIIVMVAGAFMLVCSLFMKWERVFMEGTAGG